VERLSRVPGVDLLVESWRVPQTTPHWRFSEARAWLEEIDTVVREVRAERGLVEGMDLTREVVERLRLPPFAANPLVARSLASHG
jgi:hydroxyacylglutathione hydrolase